MANTQAEVPANIVNQFSQSSGYQRPPATDAEMMEFLTEMNNENIMRDEFSNLSRGGRPIPHTNLADSMLQRQRSSDQLQAQQQATEEMQRQQHIENMRPKH